jgi:hypothetical protein
MSLTTEDADAVGDPTKPYTLPVHYRAYQKQVFDNPGSDDVAKCVAYVRHEVAGFLTDISDHSFKPGLLDDAVWHLVVDHEMWVDMLQDESEQHLSVRSAFYMYTFVTERAEGV